MIYQGDFIEQFISHIGYSNKSITILIKTKYEHVHEVFEYIKEKYTINDYDGALPIMYFLDTLKEDEHLYFYGIKDELGNYDFSILTEHRRTNVSKSELYKEILVESDDLMRSIRIQKLKNKSIN